MVQTHGSTTIALGAAAVRALRAFAREPRRATRLAGSLLGTALALGCTLLAAPALSAQTVIPPDTTVLRRDSSRADTSSRARTDTAAVKPGKTDTTSRAAAPAPPPAPLNPLPKGVCTENDVPGEAAADMLLVTFRVRSTAAERDAALKPINGKLVAPDPTDDASWYVSAPSGGNEFVLRAVADRLIRAPVVREVSPVQCPARP